MDPPLQGEGREERRGRGKGREGGKGRRGGMGGGEGRGARHGLRPLETSSGSAPEAVIVW